MEEVAAKLKVLSDPTRLKILETLKEAKDSTSIAEELGYTRQNVEYHLSKLCEAGFVERERVGRKVLYKRTELGERVLKSLIEEGSYEAIIGKGKEKKRDLGLVICLSLGVLGFLVSLARSYERVTYVLGGILWLVLWIIVGLVLRLRR